MKTKLHLAEKIKAKRIRKGFTQKELAKKLGCSYQLVCDWENERKVPTLVSIIKLMAEIKLTKKDMMESYKNGKL